MKLFITILFLNTISCCSMGCLKCNTENKCEICDITNQYFLEEGKCSQSKLDNCLIQNPKGTCIACNSNTLIDPNTNKCVEQNSASKEDNCLYLSESKQCLRCAQNFVIIEGKCEAVSTKIQNCLEYKSKTECQKCEQDYYLSSLTKTCSQLPSQKDCLVYTEYQCKQCKANYLHNENSLYQNLQTNSSKLNQVLMDSVLQKMTIDNNFQICYEKTIENCSEYTDTSNCFSCVTGYYLENNKCILFPSASIANCQDYLTENKCKNCKQNYYLTDDNNCRAIPKESKDQNSKCEIFKSDITEIECKTCIENHYINPNGICTERTQTVENCLVYLPNDDICQTCKENFTLSTEGLKCAPVLENCLQHSAFNKDSTPECSKCENKYYLETTCKQGTLENCLIYESKTQCSQCENKYYLTSEKKCSAHDQIEECKDYSQSVKNQCTQCNTLFRSFRIKSKCKNLPIIQNCKVYNNQNTDTTSTCSQCQDEYKLSDNKCVQITVENCLQENSDTNQCTKCKSGYYLATFEDSNANPNKCVQGYQYIHDQCAVVNVFKQNLNDTSQCNVCKKQSYPQKIQSNQSVCIKNDLMPNLDNDNVTTIQNCLTYKGNKCIKCAKDFYLKQDQSECLSNKCQGDSQIKSLHYSFYILNEDNKDYYLNNFCVEQTLTQNDNWVVAPSLKDRVQIPIKCKTNFQIINLNIGDVIDHANFNPDTNDNSQYIEDLQDIYPKVTCTKFSSGLNINGSVRTEYPADMQCQYFVKKADEYLCVSCPFGKTGSANSDNYLDSCVDIVGCSDTKLYNIHPFWSQYMSCHQCTETSKIPVIAWQGVSKSDPNFSAFKKFTLNEENWTNPSGENPVYSQPIFCLDYTSIATIKAGLNLTVPNSQIDKVNNCGYALLNLAYSNSFDNSGTTAQPINETDALICGGCKPGYKGTYIDEFYVTSCEPIQNCKSGSKWFNACSQCSDGYVYLYDNGNVDFTTCVEVPEKLKNCMAYEQTINSLSTVGKCRICKKGYNLNQDGYCELLTTVNCSTENFIIQNGVFDTNNKSLNKIFFYFYEQGLGCQKCKENYFAYQTDGLDDQICLQSDFIKEDLKFESNSTNNIDTVFVNDCEQYTNTNPNFTTDKFYPCSTCAEDFILRSDGSACVANTDKENCLQLDVSTDNCVKCKDGYGLVTKDSTKKCVEGKIENCSRYNTSTAEEQVQCKKCEEGYYIEENQCKQSQFSNCEYATGKFTCSSCKEGYWAVGERDEDDDIATIKYCLKKDESLKCEQPKITLTNNITEITCQECQDAQGVVITVPDSNNQQETDNLLTKCLTMNEIENCSVHTTKAMPTFEEQIHECQQCESDYFVSQSGLYCQERVNKDLNCSEYQIETDACKVCKDGYFIEEGGVKCISNPAGVVGCKVYVKGPVCTQCITNRYLEDNECREIEDNNKVKNCLYYSSSTSCSQCEDNYFLSDNKCEESELNNCLVLESIDSCKVCKEDFVFEVNDSKTTCKQFERTKCEILDLNSPYDCMQCADDYYIDSKGDCVKVSDDDLIENCLKYKNATECNRCSSNFVLSPDFKKCLDKGSYDENCQIQVLKSSFQCALCPAGELLKNENCVKQENSLNDADCLILDKNNPQKCYICKSNTFMDVSGKCQKTSVQDNEDSQEEVQQVNNENVKILLLSIILFIFYHQIIQFQLKLQCSWCFCCFFSSSTFISATF